MRLKYLIPFLLAAGLSGTTWANPYETTLKNGLRIIVKEDHRAPTAVQMVWYRIGSMDEIDGASGVAHVLEHMMFKGTPTVGPGEFNKRVAAAGGRDNDLELPALESGSPLAHAVLTALMYLKLSAAPDSQP